MNASRVRRLGTLLVGSILLVAACGGSDEASSAPPPTAADTTEASGTEPATPTSSGAPDDAVGPSDDFEPGDVAFRVVNTLDEPVDIYVRTSGLVEAFAIADDVESGAVTDPVAPPADGVFLVTQAGAGDPTCVSGCDHFIAELSAFDDQGPIHTVVLYADETGAPSALDLWEQPASGTEGTGNAMPPADPARGVVMVTAVALTGADFGLRLAVDGVPGCLEPFNLDNVLVGGNQTPAFTYEGDSIEVVLHDSTDTECAGEPVGGPFTVDGGPGVRSHLILTGTPGAIGTIKFPMLD